MFVRILTIGYGDITPINIYEKLVKCIIMFVSNLLYSYGISTLSTMFSKQTLKYTEYKNKLNTPKSIDSEFEISQSTFLQKKI